LTDLCPEHHIAASAAASLFVALAVYLLNPVL
jgi:hypothetical protein